MDGGDSVTLRVKHINLWGQESDQWSTAYTYTVGAGGAGGADSATYNLIKKTDGLGVNTFPIAYSTFQNPPIANMKELVEAINAQAGKPIVTALGWWDATDQKASGYMIDIDQAGGTVKAYIASGGAPADPIQAPFTRDMVVQVSVLETSTFAVPAGIR